jgi:hypothetical protein
MDVSLVCRTARTLLVAVVVILGLIDGFSHGDTLAPGPSVTADADAPDRHAGTHDPGAHLREPWLRSGL